MTKDPDIDDSDIDHSDARYEYRVWGKQKKARKILAALASDVVAEVIDDCYFLVDEPAVNAKIRNRTLKVKRLVGHERGFERWVSKRHRNAETAPAPFDSLLEELRLDRRRGKSYDLDAAVANLDSAMADCAVFVTKRRQRYTIGSMRAEATDITIESTGEVLHTLAIEGDDIDELVALRKRLGLKGVDNVAVHVAIDADR